MRERDELLRDFHLLLPLASIRRMEFAGSAVAEQPDFTLSKSGFHASAFGFGKGWLHAVLVSGAKLDGLEPGSLQRLDDGFKVHVLEDVIGDCAELHPIILSRAVEHCAVRRKCKARVRSSFSRGGSNAPQPAHPSESASV